MSKPKNPGSYPRAFLDIADAFEAGLKERVLTFKSRREQLATRLDFYGFIRALRADGGADTFPNALCIRISASTSEPWTLRLYHADISHEFTVTR